MKILLTVYVGVGRFNTNNERESRINQLHKFISNSFSDDDVEVIIVPAMNNSDLKIESAVLIDDPDEFWKYRHKQLTLKADMTEKIKHVFGK